MKHSVCVSAVEVLYVLVCACAGIAAVILSSNKNMSPVQVLQVMLHYSIGDTISFLSLSDTHRLITPNLVAAMPPANSTSQ